MEPRLGNRRAAPPYGLHLSPKEPTMATSVTPRPRTSTNLLMMGGVALLIGALMGHVLAAQAIGGTRLAYRDHLLGFAGLTVVTGAIVAGLGARFWKGRGDISVFVLGVVQAAFGAFAYLTRFSVHG